MIATIKRKIRALAQRIAPAPAADFSAPHGDSPWFQSPNLWEPTVQLALRDLCKPGMTVFDVGANFGGLTSAMARLVGPRGIVCSFEASPRIFPHLQSNIIKQGHFNVTAYQCAVFSRSNERLKIYPGDHMNDSIFDYGHGAPGEFLWVDTVSLDDFCASFELTPSVLKLDIEGAEFEALNGATELIDAHSPHLVLEQQPSDVRCLEFLRARGYRGIDLNSYRIVSSAADFPPGVGLRNVLFTHESRLSELPYALPVGKHLVCEIAGSDFSASPPHYRTLKPVRLEAGRYLIDAMFTATGTANELMCGIRVDGSVVFRYHAYSKLLANSYRDWVLDLVRAADVELYFEFMNGTSDASFKLAGARIERLEGVARNGRVVVS